MLHSVKKQLLLSIVSVFLLVSVIGIAHKVFATGETVTASTTATTELKTASPISGITINGTGNVTVPVKLLVTNGTLSMTTTTGLTFKDASGTTVSNPQTGSTLYFSGLRADVNAALATLRYTRNATGTDTLEMSLVNPGEVFFAGNTHLYEYVSGTLDWNSAKTAALARTKYGATGYLATITSQAENDFVSARLADAGWMGASDSVSEGTWKWVAGPENSTTFCLGNNPCVAQSGQYANWNSGEPNDSSGNEDCAQFLSGATGKWNDLPCSSTTLPGYVVEYGAPGNMPAVGSANIAITTVDSVAPTTPGNPSTTTPTTTQKPIWSWGASTDGGTGLASPAYTVQWSQDVSFTTGVSSSTSNTTSFTHTTNLADGTWYFRVKASDIASNASAYSTNGSVTIDTTNPTAPDITATTTYITGFPAALTWTAATDSGIGLTNPAYTVQWSQSSSFASGISSATTNSLNYSITSLTQATWYYRIKATDALSHDSAWSNTVTIVYDVTAPSLPGTPATGTPTNNAKPTWSWTASTDGVSGLANPAYTVQWSQSPSFASGITADTANTNSFTQPASLSSGTWYFRVKATDTNGNASGFSVAGSVVIDTIAPAVSDVLAANSSETSEMISWTTDKLGSTQVQYGPTVAYGTTSILANTSPRVTSHSVALTGLLACTLYHFTVSSVDATANSATSSDNNFITSGCAGAATVTAHADTLVSTSTGGNLSLSNAGDVVSLGIPANFAGVDADFQIKKLDTATAFDTIGAPAGVSAVGNVYDIKAMQNTTTAITSFNGEVTVTMNYDGDDLTKFIEMSLSIYRWDAGPGWQKLNNCAIDTAARTVTCTTPGFSTFGLFGQHLAVAVPFTTANVRQTSRSSVVQATGGGLTTEPTDIAATSPSKTAANTTTPGATKDNNTTNFAAIAPASNNGMLKLWYVIFIVAAVALLWFLIVAKRRHRKDDKANN